MRKITAIPKHGVPTEESQVGGCVGKKYLPYSFAQYFEAGKRQDQAGK